jgi:hypothetical protein
MNVWEEEPGLCLVYSLYRGRTAYVKLFGSGPGYAEDSGYVQVHPLFPHYARDLQAVLSATDATDDPERISCAEAGGEFVDEDLETVGA